MFVCAVALVLVAWRFILPLAVQIVAGVGVEIPLPKRFVMAYPKLTISLFVLVHACWGAVPRDTGRNEEGSGWGSHDGGSERSDAAEYRGHDRAALARLDYP